jgi:hypothetical protein
LGGALVSGRGPGLFAAVPEGPAQKRAAGSAMAGGFRKSLGNGRDAAVPGGSVATGGSGARMRRWRHGWAGPEQSGGPEGR